MSYDQPDTIETAAQPTTADTGGDNHEAAANETSSESLPESSNGAEALNRKNESDQNSGKAFRGNDDLQRIKALTPEVAEALQRHGIRSYDKLATYTPGRLNHLLAVYDLSLPQYKLEMIIEQATEFAQSQTKHEPPAPAAAKAPTRAKKRQFEKHWKKDWAELANFFISFGYEITKAGEKQLQTRAIHYEGDKEEQWKSIATAQLVEWMLGLARPSLPADVETQVEAETQGAISPPAVLPQPETEMRPEASPTATPLSTDDPLLEMPGLQISQIEPSAPNAPGSPVGRLRAEVMLKLSGSMRELAENGVPYVTEAHLVNERTRQSVMVASISNRLVAEKFDYEVSLDFPTPGAGLYQSYVVARLLPPGKGMIQVKGPVINVES
jgi:predicted flap endonuclease-1-like 5' DNA nuclease